MSEATASAVSGSNGTSTMAPPPPASAPPPPVNDARLARRAAGRAAFLAAEVAPEAPPELPPVAPAEEPAPAPTPEPPAEEPDTDAEPEPKEPEAAKADPDIQKRLDVVQKAERRAKDAIAREREAFAREREQFEAQQKEWAPRLDRFEQLAKRAKYDLPAVALELGLTEEDFEPQARSFFARSKQGAADPRNREAAARMAHEREQADRLSQLEKKLEAAEKSATEREQQAHIQRGVTEFVDSVTKAVGDDAPLVRAMLDKNPEKTRQTLSQMALHLLNETGETPDKGDVIEALEKFRRAELEELGIDVEDVVRARPKTKTLPAGETKTAPTLSSDLGTPTKPPTRRQSKEERRREIIAGLERGGRLE